MPSATTMFSNTMATASAFSLMPPFLNDEKNDGPTCKPMQNTNKIRPNSRRKCRMCVSAVKPKCPIRIPVNNTKVTPSEMPKNLILPSNTPTEMTNAYRKTM